MRLCSYVNFSQWFPGGADVLPSWSSSYDISSALCCTANSNKLDSTGPGDIATSDPSPVFGDCNYYVHVYMFLFA